jgi:energy-coupling factor transporter ATP-binding protein EcfA2
MRIIAFVSQKGGCGKSTLAACLAVAAQEAEERVLVLDMDPKKSIVRWGSKRTDPHLPVEVVSAARLPAAFNRSFEAQHEPCRCRYSGLGVAKIARRDKGRRPLHRSGETGHVRHLGERGDRPQTEAHAQGIRFSP